jgi:hypothetical protein
MIHIYNILVYKIFKYRFRVDFSPRVYSSIHRAKAGTFVVIKVIRILPPSFPLSSCRCCIDVYYFNERGYCVIQWSVTNMTNTPTTVLNPKRKTIVFLSVWNMLNGTHTLHFTIPISLIDENLYLVSGTII